MEKRSVCFISLGCDKNLVDSEVMSGLLRDRGYTFTDDIAQAECVIVNTCCFIGDAKEDSINTILDIADLKNEGTVRFIVVTGCLSERYREEIVKEIPEVDALLGTASIGHIAECLDALYESGTSDGAGSGADCAGSDADVAGSPVNIAGSPACPCYFDDKNGSLFHYEGRAHTSGLFYAYLKIAEGCDRYCTYCIIPSLRGSYRSYPKEHLIKEAARLAAEGVSELILVAQETDLYGTDLYGHKALHELIRDLSGIDGIHWIRLLYCYPEEIYDELVDEIARNPKVCHYLDMPIQHASDEVLKRMGRNTTEDELRSIVAGLRDKIPDITLRTTLISGFPGETEEDFEELYRFVNEMEFDRLGVFPYSREEDTPAAAMPDQIDERVSLFRRDELMTLQQAVSADIGASLVGKVIDAVIEGRLTEEDIYVGRTYRDAPDVDGCIFMNVDRERMSGEYVKVRITEAREYDLIGEIIDEPAQ